MTNTNITSFRKNAFEYVEQVVTYGDVVNWKIVLLITPTRLGDV